MSAFRGLLNGRAAKTPPPPSEAQISQDIQKLVEEFRDQRADDIAELADRAGRSGAKLARAQHERDAWKAYARELERTCMRAGLEMPKAPDE